MGPQAQLPGVVHPQHQYYPSQPLYIQDIPLQEVPNGHDMCPTGKTWTQTVRRQTRCEVLEEDAFLVMVNIYKYTVFVS